MISGCHAPASAAILLRFLGYQGGFAPDGAMSRAGFAHVIGDGRARLPRKRECQRVTEVRCHAPASAVPRGEIGGCHAPGWSAAIGRAHRNAHDGWSPGQHRGGVPSFVSRDLAVWAAAVGGSGPGPDAAIPGAAGAVDAAAGVAGGDGRVGALRWAEAVASGTVPVVDDPLRVEVHPFDAAAKVGLLLCNEGAGLSDLEVAWVVRSLYREDHVDQPHIAQLLGHDKSWVCRKLTLAEELSDELTAHVRLGLVSATAAVELARLQRCNQDAAAKVVIRRGLTTRQTRSPSSALLARTTRARPGCSSRPQCW